MYIEIFLLCIFIGVLIGLFGNGGSVFLLPLLSYFGFTMPQVVAISLFLNMVPNTLPGLVMYYKEGHLLWRPAAVVVIATIIGVAFGSYIGSKEMIPQLYLYRVFTVMLFGIGFYMLQVHC